MMSRRILLGRRVFFSAAGLFICILQHLYTTHINADLEGEALYHAFKDDLDPELGYDPLPSWNLSNNKCTWPSGITCDLDKNFIIKVELSSSYVSGSLTPELGDLIFLETLALDNNYIGGSIPAELGNLINLQNLALDNNHLNGNIPAELGNLKILIHLDLSHNTLTGLVPPELGNLTTLKNLWLNDNQLGGCFPTSVVDLVGVYNISLNITNNLDFCLTINPNKSCQCQ